MTDAVHGASAAPRGAMPLLDAAQAAAGDGAAVAAGATWHGLMERAGGHLARGVVAAAGGRGAGLEVLLLVGKGNNGGDGWVAARRLTREHGARCTVVAVDGIDTPASDEAAANRAAWIALGGRTVEGTDHLDVLSSRTDVAVDCLLGTGARGAPRGPAGEAAAALVRAHAHGTTVVACDIPSGVAGDDGSVAPGAVMADVTVTFGALKRGLLLHPGAAHAGRVLLGRLGEEYDRFAATTTSRWSALTPTGAAPPPLLPEAEKRARGVVLAVAGAAGTAGAAALTGAGALRAGAGLVTVATPDPVRGEVAARVDPGVMVRGLPSDEHGGVHADAVHALPALEAMDVVVAGPGLGHGAGAREVVAALRHQARRLVLDADALNVHRDDPSTLADHAGELVLTPHERELARIGGGEDGPEAWESRVERVPELAHELQATIVAKGPGTLVAAPDGRVWVCPIAGPALGSGGTGDVLAGVIAAAIAHADDVPLAVAQAVWWHAAAGVLAGTSRADRATATDLLAALPTVLAELAELAELTEATAARASATSPSERVAAIRRAARWGALPWEVRR